MTQPTDPTDPDQLSVALELLQRTNDFLTLCMTRSELALDSDDPAELIEALKVIRDGATDMADTSEDAQRELGEVVDFPRKRRSA